MIFTAILTAAAVFIVAGCFLYSFLSQLAVHYAYDEGPWHFIMVCILFVSYIFVLFVSGTAIDRFIL